MRTFFVDLVNIIFRPKRYAASANLYFRDWFHSFSRILFSSEVKKRDELDQQNNTTPLFQLSEKIGHLRIGSLFDEKLKQEVIAEARRIMQIEMTPDFVAKFANAPFVSIPIQGPLSPENPFLKFALHKPLLKALTRYFSILPVIENISIWYSPNDRDLSGSSQLYHLDGQDVKTIQLFLFIEDVDTENGPLVVVDAERSVQIAKSIGYRKTKILKRVDDELIRAKAEPSEVIQATGSAGECYIVDTDRCFHFGSRKASRPRYLVVFQYYTPFAFVLPWKWWKKLPYAHLGESDRFSPIERAVLGRPATHPGV